LIDYLLFYVSLKNFSLIWRRHHCRWRAAKSSPMLGAQGLWAGRDLYRATPAVTRDLGFSGLIRRTAPFSRLLRHTRSVWRTYSNPDAHGSIAKIMIISYQSHNCDRKHKSENEANEEPWHTRRGVMCPGEVSVPVDRSHRCGPSGLFSGYALIDNFIMK
jgi:hypothetical protein